MIVDRVLGMIEKSRKLIPVNSNWASQMGEDCLRFLVLHRTSWELQELPSLPLMCRFDIGHAVEAMALRKIEDAFGQQIILRQQPFVEKRSGISGKIEGVIQCEDGKKRPLEIKSMATAIFEQFSDDPHDLSDFEKYPWTRKYVPQLSIYLYLAGYEEGVLVLVALDGRYKEKIVKLDYDLVDGLIKKAEAVNAHVAAGTLPDYHPDAGKCLECRLFTVCKPPMKYGDGPVEINHDDLAANLRIWDETRKPRKAYEDAYENIKSFIGARPAVLCDKYQITRTPNKKGALLTKITVAGEDE